ncbi:EKC/KEOPS complex subunit bud32 [Rhopalosiphum maidis]|uniref:EKC/KEOPS complex subunit bud32 n=1 Tax=Rhopalosiphum maidis TaxID=43146 RepID=UPI000F0028D3|nr:EKC/KEOPS complex subunit bud32 [Rhopalosiphum maidis]
MTDCNSHTYLIPIMEIYKQGAESKIFTTMYSDRKAIIKERFSRQYRNNLLDLNIRKERTKAEVKAILKCKLGGIATPVIYSLDLNGYKIIMEYISGQTVNEYLTNMKDNKLDDNGNLKKVLMNIGAIIGKMHSLGVFHGDLTTSNIIKKDDDTLVLIDFGLSHFNPSVEDKAVDLYVLERAFVSTHSYFTDLFAVIIDGYKIAYELDVQVVLNQFQNVRGRGRKRLMIG